MTTTASAQGDHRAAMATASPWPTFALCAVAAYITTLDLSIVNVAFAEIAKTFAGTGRSELSWIVSGYAIVFGSFLLVAGQSADRLGRKRVLMAGLALFLVGSLLCAVSGGLAMLVAGRVVQGLGGALITPSSTGLVLAAFGQERRGQVMSWVGGVAALGIASGPTIGALMIDRFGWRSAFWINVPICAITAVVGMRVWHETTRQQVPLPDLVGAVLFTVGTALVVLAISQGEQWGWSSARLLAVAAGGLGALCAVVLRSRVRANPALPLALFRERTFSVANAGSLAFGAGFSAMALNNVLFLRGVWHYSVVRAGWFSVLSPLVVAVVAPVAGRMVRGRGLRMLMFVGPALFCVSQLAYVLLVDATPTPWTYWLPIGALQGVAIGCTFPVLGAAAVARLPGPRLAEGTAVNNTFRQVGAALGVASVVAIQGLSDGVAGFRNGWWFSAACGAAVGLLGFVLP